MKTGDERSLIVARRVQGLLNRILAVQVETLVHERLNRLAIHLFNGQVSVENPAPVFDPTATNWKSLRCAFRAAAERFKRRRVAKMKGDSKVLRRVGAVQQFECVIQRREFLFKAKLAIHTFCE